MKSTLLAIFAFLLPATLPVATFAAQPPQQELADNLQALAPAVDDWGDPTTAFLYLNENEGAATGAVANSLVHGSSMLAGEIIDFATRYLGRPYRHGSKGPSAFDCSGFTSFVFGNFDIKLSPSSSAQYYQGVSIGKDDIQPGDLLFFAGRRGGKSVGHVALAVSAPDQNGRVRFIHASNKGGICHDTYPDGGYYSQRYIGARRVLTD